MRVETVGSAVSAGNPSMSLKAFHILFITLSILLAWLVGAWGVRAWLVGGGRGSLALGGLFFVLGFVLLGYGVRFIRKVRELGI